MDDETSLTLDQIKRLLLEHESTVQAGVRGIWVIDAGPDRLVVKQEIATGEILQVSITAPSWQRVFLADDAGFIETVLNAIPRTLPAKLQVVPEKINLRYLFISVMDDLINCTRSSDDYDMLRVAGLLRLLLLDDDPLLHQVNRDFGVKLTFRVGTHLPDNLPDDQTGPVRRISRGLIMRFVGPRFDPSEQDDAQEVSLDKLLSLLVAHTTNESISVKELIKHLAHVRGVIHGSKPAEKAEQKDKDIFLWRSLIATKNVEPSLVTLQAIGRVVAKGLMPIYEACK